MDNIKKLGQIFTPEYIAIKILDEVGYEGENIIDKKIFEPSFGEGIFLIKIVQRLIHYCESISMPKEKIKEQLENNIYGVEISFDLYQAAINSLNLLVETHGFQDVKWKIYNLDTLTYINYDFFDFVVGNPPYVRIHNLSKAAKSYLDTCKFTNGITDMYIIFFELGISFLNKTGKLGYITPNSYMKNTSQSEFRKYLIEKNLLEKIIDYNSYKIFNNADTYTAITILNKAKKDFNFQYSRATDKILFCTSIDLSKYNNNQPWNFNSKEVNDMLEVIKGKKYELKSLCNIQYGISTNKDDVYIINPRKTHKKNILSFEKNQKDYEIEKNILRRVIKGSTYNGIDDGKKIIFPYKYNNAKKTYEPLSEKVMRKKYPLAYKYLCDHKKDLELRDMDKNVTAWYQYARSQGLINIPFKKLTFKHILSAAQNKIIVYELPKNVIVYSGIFITCDNEENINKIKNIIETQEFCKYALNVGKDMSGGYKNISSKMIKAYRIDNLTS